MEETSGTLISKGSCTKINTGGHGFTDSFHVERLGHFRIKEKDDKICSHGKKCVWK